MDNSGLLSSAVGDALQLQVSTEALELADTNQAKTGLPGFRTHTSALLQKEWKIKWKRWTGSSRTCCRCTCSCCRRCPSVPTGFLCEVIFPLLVLAPLCYMAYSCTHPRNEWDGCAQVTVGGWGGSIPQPLQNDGVTRCNQPDPPPNNPYDPPDVQMSCNAWPQYASKPGSFLDLMLTLQSAGLKLAWVTKDPADRPKLDRMIRWISRNWYPGFANLLPRSVNSTVDGAVKMCYSLGTDHRYNYLNYDQFDQKCDYDSGQTPECCTGAENYGSFGDFMIPSLRTEADLLSYLDKFDVTSYADVAQGGPGLMWAAVVFQKLGSGDGSPGSPGDWQYTIRMNSSTTLPDTTSITTLNGCTGYGIGCTDDNNYESSKTYITSGFATLQLLVDRYILNLDHSNQLDPDAARALSLESGLKTLSNGWGRPLGRPSYDAQWNQWIHSNTERINRVLAAPLLYGPELMAAAPLPVADSVSNTLYGGPFAHFWGLFFVIGFLYTMYGVVVQLIQEKQTKVRESLKMMGVDTASLLASFYLLQALIFGSICLVMTLFLTVLPGGIALLPNSSPLVVFLFLWLWCMAFVSFSFAFHTLSNRPMLGGLLSALGMLAQFIVYAVISLTGQEPTGSTIYFLSLFPNCALCVGLGVMQGLEATTTGATFSSLSVTVNETSMASVMELMLLNSFMWTTIGWYLEKVLPKEYGVRLKPWFICTPTFWLGQRQQSTNTSRSLDTRPLSQSDVEALGNISSDDAAIEPVSAGLKSLISLRGLRKTFPTPAGTKVAVHSLNLECFENQITALLGHNGAGKTTTISMLTGMLAPTAGDAQILGLSISQDMTAIRKSIGCCPQHDILWEQLTVQEHLNTFAKLKGLDPATCVPAKIAEVGLTEKIDVKAGELSGGMKRKLSLCMALIGDAKVIFLDEPTSGMDPFSRRSTWNMLIANRPGRAMILTTHFMDEADLLGDRIAIMAEGVLQCCGSSMFLKNRFGAGYRLICTRQMDGRCDASAIEALLRRHVPDVKMLTDVGAEMTFQLPTNRSSAFPAMLRQLDEQLQMLGVQEYGVSQVTLEEVFLKVGKSAAEPAGGTQVHQEQMSVASMSSQEDSVETSLQQMDSNPDQGFLQHFRALALKRLHYGKRDKSSICCMLILPALMLWGCIALIRYQGQATAPKLVLDASQFHRYTDSPLLPWNSSDGRAVSLAQYTGKQTVLPPVMDDVFFGRNYSSATGLPTTNSYQEDWLSYIEPQKVLSMFETMWADGSQSDPQDVQWGGLLFPWPVEYHQSYPQETRGTAAYVPVTVLYNESASHAVPTFANAATNALRHRARPSETGLITLSTQPLPMKESRGDAANDSAEIYIVLVVVLIVAFAFVPSAIIAFPVMESEAHHNSRHQQYISGVSIPAYWLANYVWDMALFLVLLTICVFSFQFFDVKVFTTRPCSDCTSTSWGSCYAAAPLCRAITNASSPITCSYEIPPSGPEVSQWDYRYVPKGVVLDLLCPESCGTCGPAPFKVVVLTLLSYGFAISPVTYLFSLLFSKHTTAQMVTLLANILFGLFLVLTSLGLSSSSDTKDLNDQLLPFFRISPSFNLGWSVLQIAGGLGGSSPALPPKSANLLAMENCGASLLALLVVSLVTLPLVMFVDYLKNFPAFMKAIPFCKDAEIPELADYEVDEDVRAEEERVFATNVPMAGQAHDDVIHIRNLRKVYGRGQKAKVAVRSLTIGLQNGTCFGFLGINGAGKTSTMVSYCHLYTSDH